MTTCVGGMFRIGEPIAEPRKVWGHLLPYRGVVPVVPLQLTCGTAPDGMVTGSKQGNLASDGPG